MIKPGSIPGFSQWLGITKKPKKALRFQRGMNLARREAPLTLRYLNNNSRLSWPGYPPSCAYCQAHCLRKQAPANALAPQPAQNYPDHILFRSIMTF
jgi:hypothetical protein